MTTRVKKWTFKPAEIGDKPVSTLYVGKVMFSLRPDDEQAITELVRRGVTAWNNGDLQAIANLFWPDAHFHDASGGLIKQDVPSWFRDHIEGTKLTSTVDMIRFSEDTTTVKLTFRVCQHGGEELEERIYAVVSKRDGTWRVADGYRSWDSDPVLVSKPPEPRYTKKASNMLVSGEVVLEVLIRPDGTTEVLSVLKSLPFGLEDAAIKNAQLWRWEPALKDGKPVGAVGKIRFSFSFKKRGK